MSPTTPKTITTKEDFLKEIQEIKTPPYSEETSYLMLAKYYPHEPFYLVLDGHGDRPMAIVPDELLKELQQSGIVSEDDSYEGFKEGREMFNVL